MRATPVVSGPKYFETISGKPPVEELATLRFNQQPSGASLVGIVSSWRAARERRRLSALGRPAAHPASSEGEREVARTQHPN